MTRRRTDAMKSKNPVKFVCVIIAVSFLVIQIFSALQLGKVSSTPKPRRKIAGVSEIGKFGEILIGMFPEDLAFTLFLPSEKAFRCDLRLKQNDSNSYAILTRVLGFAAVPRQIGLADLPSGEEKRYESISGFNLHVLKDGKGMTVVNGVVAEKVGLKMGNLMVYMMNGVVMGAEFAQSMEPEEEEETWNKAEAAALERKQTGIGDGSVGMLSSLLVAALSGCVNVLLTNPIWVVVTRMQTHTKNSQPSLIEPLPVEVNLAALESPFGTSHAIQEVYDEAGVLGFWNGVLPTLIMVSNPSIQFMLYETLLKKLKERRLSRGKLSSDVTALEIFLLGALAKLGATVVTYPILVVKSRLQAKQMTGGDKRHHYKGTLDAILKMIRYEGFYGFYKGMSTKIVQSVLAAAILFMVKEELVKGSKWLLTRGAVVAKPKTR